MTSQAQKPLTRISDNVTAALIQSPVTVTDPNDAPDAVDDTATTTPGDKVVIDALGDTDPDNDTLTITSIATPANGSAIITGDGKISYTPEDDFTGTETFEYTISDGNGGTDTATVTVTVTDPNDAPDAVDDTATTTPGDKVVIDALGNDTDPDNDALTITSIATPANGSAIITGDGKISYTPEDDFTGTETFEYTISDGNGGTDTATVTVTVTDPNDAPDAVDDTATTTPGDKVVIDALGNDTDPDNDALTITSIATPANGSAIITGDGKISYTPEDDFTGTETFEYTISDGNGGTDTATVTVTVTDPNDAPDAVDDTATTTPGDKVVIDALGNDTDPDNDALTITSIATPANGSAIITGDGKISYTPEDDFTGTETFEYTISDGNGGTDTATVTVTVTDPNDAPDAVDDTATTTPGDKVVIDALGNDTDPDNDTLTITSIATPANGSAIITGDGKISYTPEDDFTGTETFEYTISDGNGGTDTATVTVTVTDPNDAPDAVDDTATTTPGDKVVIDALGNDTDPDNDALTITSIATPANGSAIITGDGKISYTPEDDFTGTETFEYTISDGNGGTDTATVTVTVTDPNDAPDAVDDTATTTPGDKVVIDALGNDTDPDNDALTITSIATPANGSAIITGDGKISYTPEDDFTGTETFEYTISDGNGGTDTATVTVTVTDPNDAPDAVDDTATTTPGDKVVIDALGNDTDPDNDALTITSIATPANGSAIITGDGKISYTPEDDFTGTETFEYTISDGNGGTDTATVTVTVTDPNDAPDAVDDTATTTPGDKVVIDALGNDTDPDNDALTITSIATPANGSAIITGDGKISYTPEDDFTGTETFEYTISDGNGGTDTATVTVTVTDPNDAPDAVDDTATTTPGDKVVIDALGNDTDPDNDTLTITSIATPANGSAIITGDGKISYTPEDDFTGTETFEYTISDGNGGTDTATVTVTVTDPNDAPDAVDDTATTTPGDKVVIDALGNDTDPDNDTLTITSIATPANGSAIITGDGKISYTPEDDFTGTETFEYTISDGNGGTDTAQVTVTVESGNSNPVANDDFVEAEPGTKLVIDAIDNDSDPEGDTLTIIGGVDPTNGTSTLTPEGNVSYTPNDGFTGADSLQYTISDGNGGTDTATIHIDVKPAPAKASIVGSTMIDEGGKETYNVQLDHAVDKDTYYTIQITDGSANRVDHSGAGQDIMWGGILDYRNGRGQVVRVIEDAVPNTQRAYYRDGWHQAHGPSDASWDYTVSQNGSINQGDTIRVFVPAGETMSDSFNIDAWKEKVAVDLDAGTARGYQEGTETFNLNIVSTTGSDTNIELDVTSIDVEIKDKTHYMKFSPITLDLNGDGIHTTALGETEGRFDLLNNDKPIESGWLSGEDAFLAVDTNGNGIIDDRSELFGGAIGDGFAKLAGYDSNNDGVVDAQDANFSDLQVWQDSNENHQTDEGELISLDEAGIASLNVDYTNQYAEDNGNVLLERGTATSTEGESIDMADVYFNIAPTAEELEGSDVDVQIDFSEFLSVDDNMDALLGEPVETGLVTGAVSNTVTDTTTDSLQQLADLQDQEYVQGGY